MDDITKFVENMEKLIFSTDDDKVDIIAVINEKEAVIFDVFVNISADIVQSRLEELKSFHKREDMTIFEDILPETVDKILENVKNILEKTIV